MLYSEECLIILCGVQIPLWKENIRTVLVPSCLIKKLSLSFLDACTISVDHTSDTDHALTSIGITHRTSTPKLYWAVDAFLIAPSTVDRFPHNVVSSWCVNEQIGCYAEDCEPILVISKGRGIRFWGIMLNSSFDCIYSFTREKVAMCQLLYSVVFIFLDGGCLIPLFQFIIVR